MVDLTRNLYRLDEVRAAAMFCLIKGRAKEACFWLAELIVSDLMLEAIYCMFYVWLIGIGPLRLEWYRRAWEVFRREEIEPESILQFGIALAASISSRPRDKGGEERDWSQTRDTTAVLLLVAGAAGKLGDKGVEAGWKGVSNLEQKGLMSRLHGLAGADARLHQTLAALEASSEVVGEGYAERLRKLTNCVAYLATCVPKEYRNTEETWRPVILHELEEDVKGWLTVTAVRRKRRVYEVPYTCLYGMTARGELAQNETNIEEIRYGLEGLLRKSTYWSELVPAADDDDGREAFYDREFPDDIPDEWSLVDQQKSHGMGARMGAGPISFLKMAGRWFPSDRSVWLGPVDAERLWNRAKEVLGEKMVEAMYG
jgi:hypothetical protein